MKFTLALIAVSVFLFGLIQALPNERYRRATAIQQCPADISCEAYIEILKMENKNSCIGYTVHGGSFTLESCPPHPCQKLGKEDLTKPYPDCCAKCE